MENKTFAEFFRGLPLTERDSVTIDLSNLCHSALMTVHWWGQGYRNPKMRAQDTIVKYFKTRYNVDTDRQTLFPEIKKLDGAVRGVPAHS